MTQDNAIETPEGEVEPVEKEPVDNKGPGKVPGRNAETVLQCFRDHKDRALAPDEVRTLLGYVKWDVKAAFAELAELGHIEARPTEVHTVKDAVVAKAAPVLKVDATESEKEATVEVKAEDAITEVRFRRS